MIHSNKNISSSLYRIVALFSLALLFTLALFFVGDSNVSAQTCFGEGYPGNPETISCIDPETSGTPITGKCYQLVDDQGRSWAEITCPSTAGGIEGPTLDELRQEQLTLQNNNTAEIVESNPIYDLLLMFINFLSAGVGILVVTLVAVGGVEYMAANGNPQKTQVAITRITNALIGLVLYIFMFAVLQWLIPGGLFDGSTPINTETGFETDEEIPDDY